MDDSRVNFGNKKKVSFFEIFKFSKFWLFLVNCLCFHLSSSAFKFSSVLYTSISPMLHQTLSPSVGSLDLVLQFLSPRQSPVYVVLLPLYHLVSTLSFCHAQYNTFTTTTTTMITTTTAATATTTTTTIITGFACV